MYQILRFYISFLSRYFSDLGFQIQMEMGRKTSDKSVSSAKGVLALSSSVASGTRPIFWGKSERRKEAIEFFNLLYITFVIVDGRDCSERIKSRGYF